MKVTSIPIVIGSLSTVTEELIKGLEDLEIRGRVETIQTIALLRSARILRRVLELKKACCHSNSAERLSATADGKNSQGVSNNNNNNNNNNARHKLLWDFNIKTDHLIPARRPDLIIIKKKRNLQNSRLCCPG